jgi:hypothetical protein
MTDWTWVLTPLLVLPIVLLFRFLGCGDQLPEDQPLAARPNYRDFILGKLTGLKAGDVKNTQSSALPKAADVIGYWRLIEPGTKKVTGDISTQVTKAKDENLFQDGTYIEVHGPPNPPYPFEAPDSLAPNSPGSEQAPGTFEFNQPGLIVTDAAAKCRKYNGGYVLIPSKPGLFTDEFTIEAWVDVQWNPTPKFDHVLFDCVGRYALPTETNEFYRGFRIFADGGNHWQVFVPPTTVVFKSPPLVPRGTPTHVAVSFAKGANPGERRASLFVNGKLAAGPELVPFYLTPEKSPLIIGAANEEPKPTNARRMRKPVLSSIQEVVLHRTALTPEAIENHFDLNRENT